ncbi:MAG: hypothetical protein JXR77_01750 [Lentisphaeria bacterium]|nr:hypothetical protein [Lentisphaeria bacterium]
MKPRILLVTLLLAGGLRGADETPAPPALPPGIADAAALEAAPPPAAEGAFAPEAPAPEAEAPPVPAGDPVPAPLPEAGEGGPLAPPEGVGPAAPAAEAPAGVPPAGDAPSPAAAEAAPAVEPFADAEVTEGGLLRFHFRAAPLDTVLQYLSRAAGFIIVRDAAVAGSIDIVSHQPITPEEAVALLHTVLNDRGYGVVRSDRILEIVKRDAARTRNLPVVSGSDPEAVEPSGELVTQIISLRRTNAPKLVETLRPFVPEQTLITANADSNALVVTDTRTNIRRMLEIIKALDTAVSSILDIAVIPLQYADAVETADVINKVYETPTSRSSTSSRSSRGGFPGGPGEFFARMRGGGDSGGGNAESNEGQREAKQTSSYVKAVADERGNAVVVTAPADILAQIRELVSQLDMPTEDITTVRVLPLRYADATEMANLIAGVYQDSSSQSQSSRYGRRTGFRGFPFGPPGMTGGSQASGQSGQSERKLTETKVLAVADTRTNSVIVSASMTLMTEIVLMVEELDATPANVPTVHIFQLRNADATRAKEILDSLYDDLDGGSSRSSGSRTSTYRSGTGTTSRSTTPSTRGTTGTTTGSRTGGR